MVFIKNVIVHGFKSYREQVGLQDFVEGANAIVGRNGTGKSNFFDAIRFVLCESKFVGLSAAERQHLLYEGPGTHDVLSAYVEIHFDNSDGRFPVDRDTVVLRRTIGVNSDEFFLDKRHVTRADVVALLESAGFSRANPYYIVQQGKVNALALMKDEARLELLHEVAGTKVYDERRAESMRLMQDTDSKRAKIADVLAYIEERLAELEDEKAELEAYRVADRERRTIEWVYYQAQLRAVEAKLDSTELQRKQEFAKANNIHEQRAEVQDDIVAGEQRLATLEATVERLRQEREATERERQALLQASAKLNLDVQDASSAAKDGSGAEKDARAELKEVHKRIKAAEKELAAVAPQYDAAHEDEVRAADAVASAERRCTELYGKRARATQFESKKARDAWLAKELAAVRAAIAEHRAELDTLQGDSAALQARRKRVDADVVDRKKALAAKRTQAAKAAKALSELRIRRDTQANERKELWRRDAREASEVQVCRAENSKAERNLIGSVGRAVSKGIQAIRDIAVQNNIGGVYGPLIELIEVPPQFHVAAEVAAKGALFHIVVDTDATATRLLALFNAQRVQGRVNFLPLNRMAPAEQQYPQSPDVRPLVTEIQCRSIVRPAVQQVFGRTLVCRNLEVAAMMAKQAALDCLTLDGDQVARSGALTGGFNDPRDSRLLAMERVREWRGKVEKALGNAEKTREQLASVDAEVSATLAELEQQETKLVALRTSIDAFVVDLKLLAEQRAAIEETLAANEKSRESLETALKALDASEASMRAEQRGAFESELTAAEADELERLNRELQPLKQRLAEAAAARATLEEQKSALEMQLRSNLYKRRDALDTQVAQLAASDATLSLDQRRNELQLAERSLDAVQQRLGTLEEELREASAEEEHVRTALDALKVGGYDALRQLQDEAKSMERLLSQRAVLVQQRDEYARKLRDLGLVPNAALTDELADCSASTLLKKLKAVNAKLKKYAHVNKKAADQYVNFTDQRESLKARKLELDEGAAAISDLTDSLDRKKDEAIERTFKQVAKNFRETFAKLVPGGSGKLTMLTVDPSVAAAAAADATDVSASQTTEAAATAAQAQSNMASRLRKYTGVGVNVVFTKGTEAVSIQQLSGGQKSLVALALIFAIQKCDPAPFYLFDEIDAALDTTYRTAVAKMIKEQAAAENTQFILASFKPELLEVADKYFGISFTNEKVSQIGEIEKNEALQTIQGVAQSNE